MNHAEPTEGATPSPEPAIPLLARIETLRKRLLDQCIPPGLEPDTEPHRRARLVAGFGLLGVVFGPIYALFYLLIGHFWGMCIIIVCSVGFAAGPLLLRGTGSIRISGNFLTGILLAGFTALCAIEGGARGHAIGWLAGVPLCALLLVEGDEVALWCTLSIVTVVAFVGLDLARVPVPVAYPMHWHGPVTAAGYVGLTIFLAILGFIFEGGRRRAFSRMERALTSVSEVNARLKRLDAEKNEFLGVAAHDLKNPLNIVMGFAEMIALGRNKSSERDQQDARYIIEAAERMITLITELLDVNAIEQGRFPLDIAPCDLGSLSQQVVSSFSAAASRKQLTIYAAGPLAPARVVADASATRRILDNLLSNAIKYSPPGGDVFVRIRNTMDCVVWEVQDRGAGLTPADKARLFQKFTKLSARPTGGESSTGLGLSIVKMLADAMKGTVECASEPGHGATFSLRLPPEPSPDTEPASLAA